MLRASLPLLFLSVAGAAELPPAAKIQVDFVRDVKPILEAKCLGCHGKSQQQSGLRLDKRQNAFRGGDYGPVILPGRSAESKLIHRVAGGDAGLQMPPTGALEPADIGILRAWIDQGAEFPETAITEAERDAGKALEPKLRAFFDAVGRGDVSAVRKALRSDGALKNARDNAGSTALMHAGLAAGPEMTRALLEAGADPNAKNKRNATALFWSITDLAAVRLLLAAGADPNARSVEGRTPLTLAAMQPGGADVLKLLLDKGANANDTDLVGRTALMAAATAGNVESMGLLLAAGAKVDAAMASGSTALFDAARSRNLAAVRLLIDKGADAAVKTKRGGTPLGIATSWGSLDITRLLLEKGAAVNARDERGYTPLMYAAYSEAMPAEVVRLLLAKGADRGATGEGETAMSLARKRGETEVVRLLQ